MSLIRCLTSNQPTDLSHRTCAQWIVLNAIRHWFIPRLLATEVCNLFSVTVSMQIRDTSVDPFAQLLCCHLNGFFDRKYYIMLIHVINGSQPLVLDWSCDHYLCLRLLSFGQCPCVRLSYAFSPSQNSTEASSFHSRELQLSAIVWENSVHSLLGCVILQFVTPPRNSSSFVATPASSLQSTCLYALPLLKCPLPWQLPGLKDQSNNHWLWSECT